MSDPKRHRGEFAACSDCDRPRLCAVLKPKTQPCWQEPAPPGTAWRRLAEERPPDMVAPAPLFHTGGPAANLLNAVYTERNRVVAGLARAVIAAGGLAGLATNPAEPDWPVVIIDLPGYGQVSWHVPEAEAEALFSFLGPYPGEWDGHTTEETYDRLAAYAHERASMAVWAAS